jgi:hypothetical protein
MTDRLEEALAALRDGTAPEECSGEATLERIRRSLAASEDASERTLEAALTPLAEVEVLYGEEDRLLALAAGALRAEASGEVDGAETLERIRRSLAAPAPREAQERGERFVELAAAEPTAPLAPARDAGAPPARALDTRRARPRWALAAAAALALAVVPPTAWAWSTGQIERWIARIAAPSALEPRPAPRGSEAPPRETAPRETAPRVDRVEERDPPAQEASVIVESSGAPSAGDERASPRPATPRRPPRRGGVSVTSVGAHRADPPAAEPLAAAEEPALPSPESSSRPPAGAEERELFARAHHLHFGGAPHSAALAAWDDYLRAYPRGHYAPEARYNRALTLVRLGRVEEARRVLARFAAAPAGGYRRDEARALLDAIGASVAAPAE